MYLALQLQDHDLSQSVSEPRVHHFTLLRGQVGLQCLLMEFIVVTKQRVLLKRKSRNYKS